MSAEFDQKVALLESHGWTVESENPFEARHDESGSFASGLAAHAVADMLRAELEAELDQPMMSSLSLADAFVALQAVLERAQRYVAIAQASSTDASLAPCSEETEAWQVAFELVFSDDIRGQVQALSVRLNSPFTWDDADTSYREDVCAFVQQLSAYVHKLAPYLRPSTV